MRGWGTIALQARGNGKPESTGVRAEHLPADGGHLRVGPDGLHFVSSGGAFVSPLRVLGMGQLASAFAKVLQSDDIPNV